MPKPLIFLFLFLPLLSLGCAAGQLRFSTVEQAKTLSDLQHEQVLSNLAAFAGNRFTIPSQVNLKDGSSQVTDNGSIAGQVIRDRFLTLGAQRTIVDQWSVSPVTDDTTLRLLQIAYRRAFGSPEDLYSADLANGLAHALKQQTSVVDDARTINQNTAADEEMSFFKDTPTAVSQTVTRSVPDGRGGSVTVAELKQSGHYGYEETQISKERQIFNSIISTNDANIVMTGEVLGDENLAFPLIPGSDPPRYKKVTPLAIELRRTVMEVNGDLMTIRPGWLGVGRSKHDVPRDACHVARHKDCNGTTYVWVCPGGREAFEDFTIKVLSFSSLLQGSQVVGITGPRYSPGYALSGGFRGH